MAGRYGGLWPRNRTKIGGNYCTIALCVIRNIARSFLAGALDVHPNHVGFSCIRESLAIFLVDAEDKSLTIQIELAYTIVPGSVDLVGQRVVRDGRYTGEGAIDLEHIAERDASPRPGIRRSAI
jgi:hypothetical protein